MLRNVVNGRGCRGDGDWRMLPLQPFFGLGADGGCDGDVRVLLDGRQMEIRFALSQEVERGRCGAHF